ncbi:MAG: DUF4007 family protein [Aliivibrio sp.]|uniref:DUF4007 family protein n=1 Tax=Aliivibrio sp. TaxID=1872443 RepID=UPI001A3AE64B|nr:DUF4007 family protein [Aliivibrio sp.]
MNFNLTTSEYTPHFSGHESFHLRYGWLKKAYDEVKKTLDLGGDPVKTFTDDDAIARFGVGKNMVAAIRFWATACGVLSYKDQKVGLGKLGTELIDDNGSDPYLEDPSSLWLIHWNLASNGKRTSYFWAFNYFNENSFTKRVMEKKLLGFAEQYGWKKPNHSTVDKDLSVLLNTYTMAQKQKKGSKEDSLTSPLSELGLLRQNVDDKDYHLGWGPKPSLSDEVFLFALLSFWEKFSGTNTLNVSSILLEPGSPGRIFLMDENEMALRLMRIELLTKGAFVWSETAGMKQIVRKKTFVQEDAWGLVTSNMTKLSLEVA